jgi:5-methylcytosine-specific restriction enzyme subunit McrC
VRFTRLNERYRAAVILGRLILSAESLVFRGGAASTTGFLFDMNKVFEDFVTVALSPWFRAAGLRVVAQRTVHLDCRDLIPIRPDLTRSRGASTLGVADVKYKSLATKELPNADLYQVLAYAIAHELETAHLIYAAGNEPAVRHEIRNVGVSIRVHALDLSNEPQELLGEVGRLADEMVLPPLMVSI